ncbi:BsuPI-related putative proteinase inhibitor [Neobacillus niacini]|uniref:BsuPI-related putative proteinase inhibitor n=1 Tax=Neobacillus niacini TaxID=86668 RepID=UPI003B01E109
MRIILLINLFLFPFSLEGEASYGESNHQFQFSVVPIVGSETVKFELFIKNNEESPLNFEFPTSQYYEITVTDQSGHEVYRYSKGRFFLQALQTIKIEPHKTYRKVELWDYQLHGKRVPAGEYIVSATLLPRKINDKPISNNQTLLSKTKFTLQ